MFNLRSSLLIPLALGARAACAQEPDLGDLEARIEYAYFTADANSLRNLIRSTESAVAKGDAPPLAHYEAGFADYRLGLLLRQKQDAGAADAMAACIKAVEPALEANARFADGYTLQAACYHNLALLQAWKAVVDMPVSSSRLDKAAKIEPRNPRTVLIDGLRSFERPKALGGDKAAAQGKFKQAAELFDASATSTPAGPRWGAADAWLYLGRTLAEAGDTLGARNALERALIIAPDFALARDELRRLTAGPN